MIKIMVSRDFWKGRVAEDTTLAFVCIRRQYRYGHACILHSLMNIWKAFRHYLGQKGS